MRKLIACLLLFVLTVLAASGAYAQTAYRVVGYDHEDTGHVWDTNLFFERMQEKTGITLELTQYTTETAWNTAKSAMFADGGDLPDALFKADLTTLETQRWYEEGKLIDLRPYLEEYAPNLWALLQAHPDWMEAVTLPGGEIVALPAIDELQFNNAMWINQSWLKKLGLQIPTTAQELVEVLRAFRDNDMNGNGKADEVPLTFSSMWDLRFLAHAFGVNANDYYITMDETGKVSEVLTTDAWRAFLTWLRDMWAEGLLDESGFTGLRDVAARTSSSEEQEIIYGVMLAPTPVELVSLDAMNEYVLLEPLVYEGKQVYRDLTGDVIRGTFAITSACENPAELVAWVDTLYTREGFIMAEAGLEGVEFSWNDDGTWLWETTGENLTGLLEDVALRSGISMPCYADVPFQQAIDDAQTQTVIEALLRLKAIDSLPYPLVYLTQEQENRVNALILEIGRYAEYQMVWFVTGDAELSDDAWADFCRTVREKGIDELAAIFQTAADQQQ